MFALDLFNNDHERRLAEGAVDQLEQRRIDDLAMRMDDLVARAKKADTPEHKAALVKEFQKCKAERDSYYKIKDECMGYGSLGEAGIGQDIVNRQEKMARATPSTPTGKVVSTVKNAAKWLAGKGGPGKEGPTYESQKKNSEEVNEAQRLHAGDPIVVTAPNEFEGKTGEIAEFSPSGSFVVVDLYNHGQHSMHLSDVAYNDYADQEEEDDWYDDNVNDIDDGPQHAYDSDERTRSDQFEGFQDFNKVEPYEVCLAGKCVKTFDYYEDARRFHDNWKKKLYREGNKAKADKITLNPVMKEAANPAQQAAIAVAMKKAGKKPKSVDETTAFLTRGPRLSYGTQAQHTTLGPVQVEKNMPDGSVVVHCERDGKKYRTQPSALKPTVAEDTGSWIVYDPETKQIKKRFKTHTAGKSYARTHNLGFASSEFYFDRVKQPVNELDVNTLKSYADKRGAQVAAMKADNPNAPAGSPEWIKQAVPGMAVARAKQKIARKERQAGVTESAMSNVHAAMADVYHRLAPKIERHRDSFLAGQLYDELENIAELHGIEPEFKRMMAGARNRAHMDYDTNPGGFQNWFWYLPFEDDELSEESTTSTDAVERAILNRIMVAHTDLLMKFGPDKVMQAAEEVAYNVGDVDEIGTSDVSAYVNQVKQILGAPAELDEKWSQKYKSSINCANPKGFSQRAHCAGKKK